jgi:hypothetical protein
MKNITGLALSAMLLSGAAFAQTTVPTAPQPTQPTTPPASVPATQPTPTSPATTPVSPQQEPVYKPGSLTSTPNTPQTGNPSEDTLIRGNRKKMKTSDMYQDSIPAKKGKMKKSKKMGTREDTTSNGQGRND